VCFLISTEPESSTPVTAQSPTTLFSGAPSSTGLIVASLMSAVAMFTVILISIVVVVICYLQKSRKRLSVQEE
jgi:preprotein translocase subunit SecY